MAFREQLAKRLQKDSDIFYGEDSRPQGYMGRDQDAAAVDLTELHAMHSTDYGGQYQVPEDLDAVNLSVPRKPFSFEDRALCDWAQESETVSVYLNVAERVRVTSTSRFRRSG